MSNPKLTEDKVLEIYRRAHDGESGNGLAQEFGVNAKTVRSIKRGHTWGALTQPDTCTRRAPPKAAPKRDKAADHADRRAADSRAARALKEAYNPAPRKRRKRRKRLKLPSLESMLADNPAALALLASARKLRAEREAEEAAIQQEWRERNARVREAYAKGAQARRAAAGD